jgi:hypothetical protein
VPVLQVGSVPLQPRQKQGSRRVVTPPSDARRDLVTRPSSTWRQPSARHDAQPACVISSTGRPPLVRRAARELALRRCRTVDVAAQGDFAMRPSSTRLALLSAAMLALLGVLTVTAHS